MPNKTEICNMALAHIGTSEQLTNVDSDNSKAARHCRQFYDHCVRIILSSQPWPFATKIDTLVDLGDPPTNWLYRYKYPNDCALAVRIINPAARTESKSQKVPFRIINLYDATGLAILCDEEDAELEYNQKITNAALFPADFVEALSLCIAAHIAMPMRVSPDIASYVNGQFGIWLGEAQIRAKREEQEDIEPDSEFVLARS